GPEKVSGTISTHSGGYAGENAIKVTNPQPRTPNPVANALATNVRCTPCENVNDATMGVFSARDEFFTSGGRLVFTILTILKPRGKITSEKTAPFSALRCRAMKNSAPGKNQIGPNGRGEKFLKTGRQKSEWLVVRGW
ncbi:MAG: hypothetical protein WD669_00955, partial [Pirellulales bacterium]